MNSVLVKLLLTLAAAIPPATCNPSCKCTPKDARWPSPPDWTALNTSLSGALLLATPPASVCHPTSPTHNETTCALIRSKWFDSTFHATDPFSIAYPVWNNNSCNPVFPNGTSVTGDPSAGERGCDVATYPAYVVNVTSASQAATALKWAGERNIRVVVKATGHSYNGRSTGAGSLSLWTHHLRGLEVIPAFEPASCDLPEPLGAVRVAAGHTNGEIQEYLSRYGRVIVSGANPSVGIVGWLTGGGHGFLSSGYGMGSDNLLEATIALPSGTVIVANPCQNADVFAAVRGGGGGTFGVVTEVVLRTHLSPQTTLHVFTLSAQEGVPAGLFWAAMGFLHAQMQRLKERGMGGYYYITGPPLSPSLSLSWAFMLFDAPPSALQTLLAPVEKYLAERGELFTHSTNVTRAERYWDIAQHIPNEPVATGGSAYGSRLLSPSSLSCEVLTAAALRAIGPSDDAALPNSPSTNPTLIGHLTASPHPPSYFPQTTSLNEAWRDTLVHLIVSTTYPDSSPQNLVERVRKDVTLKTDILRTLSPRTGAYFNEADSAEPAWQESFWGEGYDGLRKVKERVDPGGVLWCRECVGSEAWREVKGGSLCRVEEEGMGER